MKPRIGQSFRLSNLLYLEMLDGLLGDDGEPVPAAGQIIRDNNIIFTAILEVIKLKNLLTPCTLHSFIKKTIELSLILQCVPKPNSRLSYHAPFQWY